MLIHILISLALILNLSVASQKPTGTAKPDFTGTWNARILRSGNEPVYALKISYIDPKLEIVRMRTSQQPEIVLGQSLGTRSGTRFVYYTDGRGETNESVPNISGDSMKSKTDRVGNKFVITSGDTSKDAKVANDHTITMEVSSDGKTLTETVTLLSAGNTHRTVHLYDRIAADKNTDINGEWVERIGNRIISLTIEHRDPEIKVTRRQISETQDESEVFVYYSDGRGETNTQAGLAVKSVTKWKGQALIFELSSKSKIGRDTFDVRHTIKWQIDKDGNGLVEVRQSRMSASAGIVITPDPRTLVYARSSKPLPD